MQLLKGSIVGRVDRAEHSTSPRLIRLPTSAVCRLRVVVGYELVVEVGREGAASLPPVSSAVSILSSDLFLSAIAAARSIYLRCWMLEYFGRCYVTKVLTTNYTVSSSTT